MSSPPPPYTPMLNLNMVRSVKRDSDGSALLLSVGSGSGELKKMGTHSSRLDSHYNREGISRSQGRIKDPWGPEANFECGAPNTFYISRTFLPTFPGGGGGGASVKYGKPYDLVFQLSDLHGKTVVKLQKVYRKDWESCHASGGKNNFAAARAPALHAHPAFGPSCSKPG